VLTDASDFHWGIILTQVTKKQLKESVHDQEHEPLPFLGGRFNATQRLCSIIEKETFPIMESLDKPREITFDYVLTTEISYFSLIRLSNNQTSRRRLWTSCAYGLQSYKGFRCTIELLPGKDNLSEDTLSRWIPNASKARTMAFRAPIAPLLERGFSWPSILEMQLCQEQSSPVD
jgi:hypothetical protein